MPLDTVDLRMVATLFNVQITVTRMYEEALRFQPQGGARAGGSCHLLLHQGLWAALLEGRAPEDEALQLEGAVVEADDLPPEFPAVGRGVLVKEFDRQNDCYVACCSDGAHALLERSSIRRVLLTKAGMRQAEEQARAEAAFAASGTDPAWAAWGEGGKANAWASGEDGSRPGEGNGTALEGIPDGSLEFQVLQDLVRRTARQRLSQKQAELAGRNPGNRGSSAVGSSSTRPNGASTSIAETRDAPSRNGTGRQHWPQQEQQQPQHQPHQQQAVAELQPRQPPQTVQTQVQQPGQGEAYLQQVGHQLQPQPKAPPPQVQQAPRLLDYEEACRLLESGTPLTVMSVEEFRPPLPSDQRYLALRAKERVRLTKRHGDMVFGSCGDARSPKEGWFPTQYINVWVVTSAYTPDAIWQSDLLLLQENDHVYVEKIYDGQWKGWGHAKKLNSSASRGAVRLECMRRHVYCM